MGRPRRSRCRLVSRLGCPSLTQNKIDGKVLFVAGSHGNLYFRILNLKVGYCLSSSSISSTLTSQCSPLCRGQSRSPLSVPLQPAQFHKPIIITPCHNMTLLCTSRSLQGPTSFPRLAKLILLVLLLSGAHQHKPFMGLFLLTQSFNLSGNDKRIRIIFTFMAKVTLYLGVRGV